MISCLLRLAAIVYEGRAGLAMVTASDSESSGLNRSSSSPASCVVVVGKTQFLFPFTSINEQVRASWQNAGFKGEGELTLD